MHQLLEIALADGSLKEHDKAHHDPLNACVELLAIIPVKADSINLHDGPTGYLQGTSIIIIGIPVKTDSKWVFILSLVCFDN